MTTVLKLGGSVVTEKERERTVDREALAAAADAVAGFDGRLVVVHGGGSFGHPEAKAHGLTDTHGSHDAAAVSAVHGAMTELSGTVVDAFQSRGVAALPVRPLSVASRDREGELSFPAGAVTRQLEEGFVPVAHGDVVAHAGTGATVLSGDEVVTALARGLDATRVGLCSDVPGVLDTDGEVVDRIEEWETVAEVLGGSTTADVTGGMAGKVRRLLELPVPAHVFGIADLERFLEGGAPGTEIRGHRE